MGAEVHSRKPATQLVTVDSFFKYPAAIRKVVYTPNASRGFPSPDSVRNQIELLRLTTQRIIEGWKLPLQNWAVTLQELTILFGDRVRNHITPSEKMTHFIEHTPGLLPP